MSKKVLIRKQSDAGGIVNYRNISERRPSALNLLSRLRDPTASRWQKINAGLNLAGKGAAAAVAANDTLQRLHGGNIAAPLTIGQTYASLDPSTMSGGQTAQEQQRQMIQDRKDAQRQRKLNALTDLRISVGDTIRNPQGVQQQLQQHIQSVNQPPAPQQGNLTVGVAPPNWGRNPPPLPPHPAPSPTQPPTVAGLPSPPNPARPTAPAPTTNLDPRLAGQVVAGTNLNVTPQPTQPTNGSTPLYNESNHTTFASIPGTPGYVNPQSQQTETTNNGRSQYQGELPVLTPARQTGSGKMPAINSSWAGVGPASGANDVNSVPLPPTTETRVGVSPLTNTGGTQVTQAPLGQDDFNFATGDEGGFNTAIPPSTQLGNVDFSQPPIPGPVAYGNSPFTTGPNGELIDKRTGQTIKGFATQVLDEFGDMLHKADPHVAGLLAFRVYMDKVLKG